MAADDRSAVRGVIGMGVRCVRVCGVASTAVACGGAWNRSIRGGHNSGIDRFGDQIDRRKVRARAMAVQTPCRRHAGRVGVTQWRGTCPLLAGVSTLDVFNSGSRASVPPRPIPSLVAAPVSFGTDRGGEPPKYVWGCRIQTTRVTICDRSIQQRGGSFRPIERQGTFPFSSLEGYSASFLP